MPREPVRPLLASPPRAPGIARPSPVLRWALLLGNAVVFGVLLWAAHLGGLIRHPEIAPPGDTTLEAAGSRRREPGR